MYLSDMAAKVARITKRGNAVVPSACMCPFLFVHDPNMVEHEIGKCKTHTALRAGVTLRQVHHSAVLIETAESLEASDAKIAPK